MSSTTRRIADPVRARARAPPPPPLPSRSPHADRATGVCLASPLWGLWSACSPLLHDLPLERLAGVSGDEWPVAGRAASQGGNGLSFPDDGEAQKTRRVPLSGGESEAPVAGAVWTHGSTGPRSSGMRGWVSTMDGSAVASAHLISSLNI